MHDEHGGSADSESRLSEENIPGLIVPASRSQAPASLNEDVVRARAREGLFGREPHQTGFTTPQLGRFVLLHRLGAGGMGVVFKAYDPELDREIAIKVLHHDRSGSLAEQERSLKREAQAMARVNHPNVVAVYEAGRQGDQLFVAMELVHGRTLRQWLDSKRRTVSEILRVFLQAGEGLAAAHGRGLVHSDFKPDNVLVDDDQRVRVLDFGLARVGKTGWAEATEASEEHRTSESVATVKTAIAGTPGYMAFEQATGGFVDERTDQFAFCVALYEALWRERPFPTDSWSDYHRALSADRPPEVPRGARAPRGLRRVVQRGLMRDPEARWPSMRTLLDEIQSVQRHQKRRHLRRGVTSLVVLGLGFAAYDGWRTLDRRNRTAACRVAGAGISDVWNDEARQTLRASLSSSEVGYAAVTADKVMPWLDDYALAWQAARTEACLDADVHGTWTPDLLERGLWCLNERRTELEMLLTELSRRDVRSVENAVQAAAGLGRVEPCRDADLLRRLPSPAQDQREEVRAVRAELSRAAAMRRTSAYEEGIAVAREALRRAEVLEWAPLVAEARLALGDLLERTGAFPESEKMLETAYFAAAGSGATEMATMAAEELAFLVGHELARHEDGLRWSQHAEVGLASLPDVAQTRMSAHISNLAYIHQAMGSHAEARSLLERALALREEVLGAEHPEVARSLNNLAVVYEAGGSYEDARALYERALSVNEHTFGPNHPEVGTTLNNLGVVHYALGAYPQARDLLERALELREQALGADHPQVATTLNNLATLHHAQGAHAEALKTFERVKEIMERTLGPDHPDVANVLNNLAGVHYAVNSLEEAKVRHEQALAIREKAFGPEHPHVAISLSNLGGVQFAMGAYEQAKALHERSLHIYEKTIDPDHPLVAIALNNLAETLHKTGAHEEARRLFERARGIVEKTQGSEHPDLAYSLMGLARVALAQERTQEAISFAEQASRVREDAGVSPVQVAEARFLLARALVGADHERARALAEEARDVYRSTGEETTTELAELEAWLGEHG